MTIIARLRSLADAFKGVELLRAKAIPPSVIKDGDDLVLGVEDDFASRAKRTLLGDSRFSRSLSGDSKLGGGYWMSYEYQNT
jgi:hypothetical protein